MSSDQAARPGPRPRPTPRPAARGSETSHRPARQPASCPLPSPAAEEQRHVEVLEAMVRRLSAQVEGLQEAMRQRAVLEQAKGVLVARSGCSLEQAFAELVRMSQHRNVKVARVAAELLAAAGTAPGRSVAAAPAAGADLHLAAAPDPTATPAQRSDGGDGPDAGDAELRAWREAYPLVLAAVEAAGSPAELAAAVHRFPAQGPPHHVMLTALHPDGSLVLLGSAGLEPRAASVWQRIPAVVDVPMTVAARFGAPVWCEDGADMVRRFPGVRHLVPLRGATAEDGPQATSAVSGVDQGAPAPGIAALPLQVDGVVHGVLGLGWVGGRPFPPPLRDHLVALADAVARRLVLLQAQPGPDGETGGAAGAGTALAAVTIALQTVLDPALLLAPVRGGDGVVEDFRVEWANTAALAAAGTLRHRYLGLTLREVTPAAVREHLLEPYRRVLDSGLPALLPAVPFLADTGDPRTGPTATISVARLFDGLVLTWRAHR